MANESDTAAAPAGGEDAQPGAHQAGPEGLGGNASVREDQVQNAVAFLTHPKVASSPVETKRSFLERKGLTAAEVADAFRRVPQSATSPAPPIPAPSTTTPVNAGSNAPSNVVSYAQAPQPAQTGPVPSVPQAHYQPGVAAVTPALAAPAALQLQPLQPQPQQSRWTQTVLGALLLFAGAYGTQHLLWPRLTAWWERLAASRRQRAAADEDQRAALRSLVTGQAALQASLKDLLEVLAGLRALQEREAAVTAASPAARRPYGGGPYDALSEGSGTPDYSALSDLRASLGRSAPAPPPAYGAGKAEGQWQPGGGAAQQPGYGAAASGSRPAQASGGLGGGAASQEYGAGGMYGGARRETWSRPGASSGSLAADASRHPAAPAPAADAAATPAASSGSQAGGAPGGGVAGTGTYDFSALLAASSAGDASAGAAWMPPPPPAPTVKRSAPPTLGGSAGTSAASAAVGSATPAAAADAGTVAASAVAAAPADAGTAPADASTACPGAAPGGAVVVVAASPVAPGFGATAAAAPEVLDVGGDSTAAPEARGAAEQLSGAVAAVAREAAAGVTAQVVEVAAAEAGA